MKNRFFSGIAFATLLTLIFSACSPVTMTSWHDPKLDPAFKATAIVVWGMFDKMEYEKPFETTVCDYFKTKGIKAIPAMSVLDPKKKYDYQELEKIFGDAGANCALIFTSGGKETTETYVPGSTTVYGGYYGNYYSYYNYGWGGYWGGAMVTETPGYWSTSTTVYVEAALFANSNDNLIYRASFTITDPEDIQPIAYDMAKKLYADWVNIKAASKN